MHREHDVIILRHDLPASGLKEGDVGAVVGVYGSGGYEIEFTAADGATVDVVTLSGDDVRPRRRRKILHVREIASTGG